MLIHGTPVVKDGLQQDAEEFLGLYLDALDEELVELHTYISTCRLASASAPSMDKPEGEAQLVGETVEKQEYTVRQLFFYLPKLN